MEPTFEGDAADTDKELEPMPSYEELQKEYEEQKEKEEEAQAA